MGEGERYIDVAGAQLRIRCVGCGPALVLVHGWALDLDMWTPQFAELSSAHRVIAFDRRGFGRSIGAPSIGLDAEDLLFLLDVLCVERAAILGMSQGARAALQAALRSPERIACLILDGPPNLAADESAELPMDCYRELVRTAGVEAFRREWLRHPFTRLCTQDSTRRELLKSIVARYPAADLLIAAEGDDAALAQSDLARIAAPVLVVNGADDLPTRRAAGLQLTHMLDTAVHTLIPDAAHLPNLDNPAAYNRVLGDFLNEHYAKAP
ncbi:MAG: alpha/beta hydrolase [Steroidobacteraceae bacterium]|jgi:pimeloyl-ACP methyl ester carboxylesterase|nr:alpha/beta hydrolase [Steroidobacteraceae bacterium]